MEKELDLTLRLGLPSPTVDTNLSLHTPTSLQGINVDGGRRNSSNDGGEINGRRRWGKDVLIDDDEEEGARNNVNVNLRVYNYIFKRFAGAGETLNFAPHPMQPSPSPSPTSPSVNDYVMLDVPARRAQRNYSLAMIANALDANANANTKQRFGFFGGGKIEEKRRCTNMNCNAINTPMWRRGPLGPKTLCNACGIKFRKEEIRRAKRD